MILQRTTLVTVAGLLLLSAMAAQGFSSTQAVANPRELGERKSPATDERLQKWLKKFPQADADGDGILTESEARAYKQSGKTSKPAKSATNSDTKPAAHANVSYGPHERNVLDFWPAAADQPTPVLIFFHGGSFKAGDKAMVQSRPIYQECLAAGISVVSANYRFSSDAPFPAPMHDGARVVQFVRWKAKEWNIDPARIALSGSSAGASLALWVALHDDLTDPASEEPVSRLSTRVTCACPHSGTAGMEPEYFQQHAGVTKLGPALWQLFGAQSQTEFESPEKRPLLREASAWRHATRDDPPLFLTYAGNPKEAPFVANAPQKDWIHHVSLGLPLKTKYDELDRECEIYYQGDPPTPGAEIAFLKRHLLLAPTVLPLGAAAQTAPKLHRLDPQTPQGLQELLAFASGPLPLVSGHRGGAWQGFPENCILTFERTLEHTFAMLEIDPRYAKDGSIVVHHDATLERTTTGKGRVTDFTLPELKQLRLKDLDGRLTEYTMPTLDEVIEWARGKAILVLDQKDVSAVDRAQVIAQHKAEAYVMLIVSSFKDVQAVRKLNPNVMMEVMIPNRVKAEEFDSLGVPWRNVVAFVGHIPPEDAALYEFIHRKGARCMIGTSRNLDRQFVTRQVTDLKPLEPEYRAFLSRGADLIETDIPAPLGQLLYRDTQVPMPLRKYFQAP